ncbi:hypothetical protein MAHJHV59_47330 [Mycobacterium avium subsp. hominissuis]
MAPLRDLFAAIFFLAIGYSVDPHELIPMLPAPRYPVVPGGEDPGGHLGRRDRGDQGGHRDLRRPARRGSAARAASCRPIR